MENAAQANPTTPQKASRMATIWSLGSSILINGALPVIIYWALKNYTAASDYVALVLTGVPLLIDSIVGIIRRKRIDLLAGIILVGIAIALMLTVLSLWRQVLSLGGLDGSLLITLVATASGILTTLFIEAIIRQSRERHRLIRELEGTRYELAVAERQAGVTEERQRLAREIHDTLVQGFTSIVMHLEAAEGALSSDMRALQRHFDQARRTARENLAEARRLMWALQPEALDRASLPEVLTKLTRSWSEENRVTASATITGTSRSLRPEIEVTLLRAAQEALANAGKYAHASQVTVTLSYMEDVVVLDVQDDGRGFDTVQLLASTAGQTAGGFGLKALRERAEQLGGTLSIESTSGEGTTIAVALPAVSNESFLCPEAVKEVSL